jgi:hypothetical protein
MRIPFIPELKEEDLDPRRIQFIKASRGGSAFLFAGGLFWTLAGLIALTFSPSTAINFYLFGGLAVVPVGFAIARWQGATFSRTSPYTILAAIAPLSTVFSLVVIFAFARRYPELVAPALTIMDAAHFVILMWLHLDYTYFLAACAKVIIGMLFLLSFPAFALVGVGLLSGGVSMLAAILVWRASWDPLRPYLRKRKPFSTDSTSG